MTIVDEPKPTGAAVPAKRPTRPVIKKKRKGPWPLQFYRSAVGKKWVMAITGLMLLGFVLIHMIGNLKVYLGLESSGVNEGRYAIDVYGEWLRELLVPALPRTVALWLLRGGLITAFFFHIHAAYSLTRLNHKARPEKYKGGRDYVAADFASRTMRYTGVIFLLFLFWHLADLSWGWVNPGFQRGAPYRNMDASLSRVPVAALYVVANIALGMHIFHGCWSLWSSLGWNNPRFATLRVRGAQLFALLIVVGNVSFPLMVQFGVIHDATVS